MSFWINDAYATVWSVEDKGKYVNARIGSSDKKQDGTYENSSWFAKFLGQCKDDATKLQEKDRIKILSSKISNVYNKDEGKSYLNMVIFKFELLEQSGNSAPSQRVEDNSGGDDVLPFK